MNYVNLSQEDLDFVFSQLENSNYRNFYLGLGPERCKALGYNYSYMKREYSLTFFDTTLVRKEILSQFNVGDKIISSEAKRQLGIIYRDLGYEKSPKASDLEEYFELKNIKLKDQTNKWVNGFEIIRAK